MFRELTYEELGFVSGGRDKNPPAPDPQVPQITGVDDGVIVVSASHSAGEGDVVVAGSISIPMRPGEDYRLESLTMGYVEDGSGASFTWDLSDTVAGTYFHDFGNGVTVTGTITVQPNQVDGLLEVEFHF